MIIKKSDLDISIEENFKEISHDAHKNEDLNLPEIYSFSQERGILEKPEEIENCTLNHTPVLSDNILFSHHHEHYEYIKKKDEGRRKKSIFLYFIGGMAVFSLSALGFFSGLPLEKELKANIFLEHSKDLREERNFSSQNECLEILLKTSTSEDERKETKILCEKKFVKNDDSSYE